MAGEEPTAVEELRAMDQHQLAIRPFGISCFGASKIVNTLLVFSGWVCLSHFFQLEGELQFFYVKREVKV